MTDISTNAHMARGEPRSNGRREYLAYSTLIFMVALPFTTLGWTFAALTSLRMPDKGPIARARSQANTITPMIFIP